MERPNPSGRRPARFSPGALLAFRPWMLALAVFLACAIGVAVMKQVGEARAIWAQATQAAPPSR